MLEPLYRIISFPGFVNLVEHKMERFVEPTTWEDTYEGYMLRLLEDTSKRKDVLRILHEEVYPNNIGATMESYLNLWSARWLCYGQCWSKISESDALWRIYSYDKMAIRIETNEKLIRSQIENSDLARQYSIVVDNVDYDLDENDALKTQTELLKESKRAVEPFYHKRLAFEHEREKRVILISNYKKMIDGLSTMGALFNFEKANAGRQLSTDDMLEQVEKEILKMQYPFEKEKLRKEMFVQISDLSQYILSVMVHPQAEDWFVKLVEKICKRTEIKCLGKSHMYDKLV